MNPHSTDSTELLARLIRAKRERLAVLGELGHRQMVLIEQGDMDGLLALLATKQRSLDELQRIERALDPFRREDPAERRWPSPEARRACAEQIEECEAMLAGIIAQERCCEAALVRRREATQRQLQDVQNAARARGAYTPPAPPDVHQLDLLCEQ